VRTFAVVVNWNGGERNLDCLAALLDQGMEPEQIVVVDNHSVDGSREAIAARHPRVKLLVNGRNEGYGHGCNRGIEWALAEGADAVLLVNNDVTAPPGVVAELERRLTADPRLGAVGPRVLYQRDPGRIWAAGGFVTFRQNLSTLRGHREPDGPEFRRTVPVDYVAGCFLLVPRRVWEQVGLLDGDFFAYHEDVDFCLRVLAAGFAIHCVGEVHVWHDAHGSTGGGYNPRRKYMMGVNTPWFLRRHGSAARWLRFLVFDVLTLPATVAAAALRGEARGGLAKALGTWHGLRGRRVTAEVLEPGGTWLW
jgi:GT2 family glycosyltransferase